MATESNNTGLKKFKYSNKISRERILTTFSNLLTKNKHILWYLETMVLSARYFQKVRNPNFGESVSKRQFTHREQMWADSIIPYLTATSMPVHVAEFGVASGRATQWWHKNLPNIKRWDGFDTFEGLPEPWTRGGVTVMNQGVFAPSDPHNPYPRVENSRDLQWHKGLISETIHELTRENEDLLFVLVDVDLLEPTRDVLNWLLTNGRPGDCVYFDEAFDPFNEGLALDEAIQKGLKFRVVGYTGSTLAIVLS